MYKMKKNCVKTYDVANYLNRTINFGKDFEVTQPSSSDCVFDGVLIFVNEVSAEIISSIDHQCLLLMPETDLDIGLLSTSVEVIFSDDPERDYYLIVKEFFVQEESFRIDPQVEIDESVTIGVNVNIAPGCKIGKNVCIGNNTYIDRNVCINDNVTVGSGCYFKPGSIIGSEGFKFIKENDRYTYVPFFGKLIIKDNVWIGSNSVIEKPSLGKAFIMSNVKIDDLVEIGADSILGENTQVAAGSIIARNVIIGSDSLLGINTVVKPKVNIGDNVTTGAGCIVINDLESNCVYIGNPAKKII